MRARSRAAPTAAWLIVVWIITTAFDAHALSLRSSKAEAFLGDIRPGASLVYGLRVENAGTEEVTLDASVEAPTSKRLKDGFDPVPDLTWVRVDGSGAVLRPGESKEIVLTVKAPKDRRWEGGQYQFDCLLRGRSSGGGSLTLKTRATLAVGDDPFAEVSREPADSGFVVSPRAGRLDGVSMGRAVAVRGPKLANAGSEGLVVRLTPARSWDETVRIEEGYVPAPNPRWLRVAKATRVAAGGMAEAALELEVPGQERYRGRKWAFVVAVDAEGPGGRIGRTWWTLLVKTADAEVARP